MSEGKSIMEMLRDAPNVEYDPSKGVTIEELAQAAFDLEKHYRNREKNGWMPEYLLSKYEAETLPLEWLQWLGENYRVLVSLEVSNIIKEREINQP